MTISLVLQCRCSYTIEHYGTFADGGAVYACTEFMDGGSLERYVPVAREALVCVGHALIRGLDYLWSNRVLHRCTCDASTFKYSTQLNSTRLDSIRLDWRALTNECFL